jgi:hypothetical protein
VLILSVLDEGFALLLELLSGDVTNVAEVLLVVGQVLINGSQTAERVQHDTRHNVTKQQPKERYVNHVIREPHDFELRHGLTDHARYKQLHQTVNYRLAHF